MRGGGGGFLRPGRNDVAVLPATLMPRVSPPFVFWDSDDCRVCLTGFCCASSKTATIMIAILS